MSLWPKLIRSGITREVILWRRWAIKVPTLRGWRYFLQGLLANVMERDIWHSCCIKDSSLEEYHDVFCPIVWSMWGGWCNVMSRCEPLTEKQWLYTDVCDRLDGVIGDRKQDNFGTVDGRVVCLDYGGYVWMLSDADEIRREQRATTRAVQA